MLSQKMAHLSVICMTYYIKKIHFPHICNDFKRRRALQLLAGALRNGGASPNVTDATFMLVLKHIHLSFDVNSKDKHFILPENLMSLNGTTIS